MKVLPLLAFLVACPSAAPNQQQHTVDPPTRVFYPGAPFDKYEVGHAIVTDLPAWEGGEPTTYAVSPTLPAGIIFDPDTGGLSGTPTQAAALSTYNVTASNEAGNVDGTFSLKVNAAAVAPTNLHYTQVNASYVRNAAIPDNVATLDGTPPFSFSVSPALPAGLQLNSMSGTISGTPTTVQTSQSYTVTATNSKGQTTASLQIAVTATLLPPDVTGYLLSPATYFVGDAVSPANTPVLSGGPPTAFTINPSLPAGLSFNTSNGHITGTPSASAASTGYTITASNAAGNDTTPFVLTLTVTEAAQPTIAYTAPTGAYIARGTRIPDITPTPSGGTGWVYSWDASSDARPQGIEVNSSTGVIGGIPLTNQAGSHYVVKVQNGNKSATAVVPLTFSTPGAPDATINIHQPSTTCPTISAGDDTVTVNKGDTVEFWTTTFDGAWTIGITSDNNAFQFLSYFSHNDQRTLGMNQTGSFGWHATHASIGGSCSSPPGGTITAN